jgi:hypothetical protein
VRRLREMVTAVSSWVFPWPSRPQRKAAIRAARREKLRSQLSLTEGRQATEVLTRLAKENHYAEHVARQIMGDRR